jgi:acetyl-CoA acyltransferase
MSKRTAVIVTGARTPFVKAFGALQKVDTIGLSVAAVEGLVKKANISPSVIDHIIWGNVVMQTNAPNVAREIVIDLNLPKKITAHSTSMACMSGLNAIMQAVTMIETGYADAVIAGGSDSTSNGEMPIPRTLSHGLAEFAFGKKRGLAAVPNFFKHAGYNPGKWLPVQPAIAERSTGKTMGWHADMMAELHKIPRADQETFAFNSHKNASIAQKKGYFKEEVVPCDDGKGKGNIVSEDNLIKHDYDGMLDKIRKLKPAFRKPDGTITAATSSALTDGASAVLVMSLEKALELKLPTDIRLRSATYCAIDPYPQLLLAPALGWHKVLSQAGLKLDNVDIIEVHEAFAAQVLVTLKCMESPEFAKKFLGLDAPVASKPIDFSKVNVNGGSIALGHPFAATGGRCVMACMNELRRSEKKSAIISICAAGGLGGVAVLERVPQAVPAAKK